MLIQPIPHPLAATVNVPGSKSLTNRALLVAALAEGETTLRNALESDDARYFIQALQQLGFTLSNSPSTNSLSVFGHDGKIPAHRAELFIGNAGTAARFLTAFVALGQGEFVIDGEPRMRERPIGDLLATLAQLGVTADCPTACPPVKVYGAGLRGGRATIAGNVSSQYLSGLLMVAPYAQTPIELMVTGQLNSKPYVDLTLALMADFGVSVERDGYQRFFITPQRYCAVRDYLIESDASAASYFFAAPAVCGGTVRVNQISRRSQQGDIAFLEVLAQMGCEIKEGANWIEVTAPHQLRGMTVDMRDISDTAQTLAAIAPFATSPTTITGIASARAKETDRIAAMCAELTRLGVQVEEYPDGLKIYPGAALRPATIQTYNDHRMAMAFALIGLRVPGVSIENPGCVSKTFPKYFEVLGGLRVDSI